MNQPEDTVLVSAKAGLGTWGCPVTSLVLWRQTVQLLWTIYSEPGAPLALTLDPQSGL